MIVHVLVFNLLFLSSALFFCTWGVPWLVVIQGVWCRLYLYIIGLGGVFGTSYCTETTGTTFLDLLSCIVESNLFLRFLARFKSVTALRMGRKKSVLMVGVDKRTVLSHRSPSIIPWWTKPHKKHPEFVSLVYTSMCIFLCICRVKPSLFKHCDW